MNKGTNLRACSHDVTPKILGSLRLRRCPKLSKAVQRVDLFVSPPPPLRHRGRSTYHRETAMHSVCMCVYVILNTPFIVQDGP